MDISRIDYWATSKESVIHSAGVPSKLIATALVIACVVVSKDPAALAGLLCALGITVRAARLPVVRLMLIALFPSMFAVLFAVSYASTGWVMPAVVILKALTASVSMALFLSTTPYTDAMALLGRVMPRALLDGMMMTYRSFFVLMGLFNDFTVALRLRSGFRPGRLVFNARNISGGVGLLFVRAYDKSQRLYDVMSIRGYSGRLAARREFGMPRLIDLPYMGMGALYFSYVLALHTGMITARNLLLPAGLVTYFMLMEALSTWKR